MAATDPIAGLVNYLRQDPDVTTEVGARVYSETIPKKVTDKPVQACVLVKSAPGGGLKGTVNNFSDFNVDIDVFAATQGEARRIYRQAVRHALRNLLRVQIADSETTEVLIHWAKVNVDGQSGVHPALDWPIHASTWQVMASDTPA